MVDPSQATKGKSLVEPKRAYEAVYLTAATKKEKISAPLPGTSVTLSPAAPVWTGVPNRSEASLSRSHNEVPSSEARFQQLLEQQRQMIQLQQQTFQSVASTIRQGLALLPSSASLMEICSSFGTLSTLLRTISRKMCPMRVRSCHFFFNTIREQLEMLSRVVFHGSSIWIPDCMSPAARTFWVSIQYCRSPLKPNNTWSTCEAL